VQATKIVSLLETYITKEPFYCGGKYRRSTGKEIVKVAVIYWPKEEAQKQ